MRVRAFKYQRAGKMPTSAVILTILGFTNIAFCILGIMLLFATLGPKGISSLGFIMMIVMTVNSTLIWFVAARVVSDIYAIRWNTDGYISDGGDERLRESMNRLADSIDALLSTFHPDGYAPESAPTDPKDQPEAYDPDHDPFDNMDE